MATLCAGQPPPGCARRPHDHSRQTGQHAETARPRTGNGDHPQLQHTGAGQARTGTRQRRAEAGRPRIYGNKSNGLAQTL